MSGKTQILIKVDTRPQIFSRALETYTDVTERSASRKEIPSKASSNCSRPSQIELKIESKLNKIANFIEFQFYNPI